jgi:hypothetical protein
MAVGKEEAEIVKARTDSREYRRIVLKNSLEVLLISDPDTDKAIQYLFKFEFRYNFLSNLIALIAIFGLYLCVLMVVFFCCSVLLPWMWAWALSATLKASRDLPIFSVNFVF